MEKRRQQLTIVAIVVLALVAGLLAANLVHESGRTETDTAAAVTPTTTTPDPGSSDSAEASDADASDTGDDGARSEAGDPEEGVDESTDESGAVGDVGHHTGASPCETGEFRHGRWVVDGTGGTPADLTGLHVSTFEGDPECMRLHLTFDGGVPSFVVRSFSDLWETEIDFDGSDVPAGPISPDFFRAREGELVDTALVVHDARGLGVLATHGREREVAARAVVGEGHAELFIRPAREGDVDMADIYEADPIRTVVRGLPDRDGLGVTAMLELTPGRLYVAGYAAAPESHVEVSVHDGPVEVCHRSLTTAGPMYLLSYYEATCDLDPGTYEVVVGWHSPTGDPADDVWYVDEIEIRS